jgi:hypothetical protein
MVVLADRHYLVLELAGLPDVGRGYEDVKVTSLKQYLRRRTEILHELAGRRSPRE